VSTLLAPPDSRPPQPGASADDAGRSGDTRPLAADPPKGHGRTWWGSVLPLPTPRLAIAVGAVAVLVALVPAAWGAVMIVLAVGIVDAVLAPAPWRVPVTRDVRDVIPLGEEAPLTWTVINPSRYPVEIAVAEDPAPSLRLQHRRASTRVAPGATARTTTHLRPSRRGRFTLAHLTVRTFGPLGLASRQHRRPHVDDLEVHPAFRSRREAELRVTRGRILEVGLRSAMAQGRGTLFEALRDYTPDDEVRRVDWAATARVGRPIVRTYRAERNQNVLILLDTGRLMAGMVGDVPRLDHAMDAAMALTTVATRLGDRAGLLAFSAGVRAAVPPRGDRGQLLRVTRAMFELEPDLTESAYDEVFGVAVAQQRSRSLLVVLTELASEALAETLVPALPLLLSRHLVVVGSVQDPDVEAWRTQPPSDTDQAYRAAGAATVRRARDRTGDLLRQMGAIVVDAPPGKLAGRLADAYLDVKVTGRL
jgi:uncharacterized protein (DUF58 family)